MSVSPENRSVADVEGPWVDPNFESGLIRRCRTYWTTPVSHLSNEMLATYLRQRIALQILLPEARWRVESGIDDDSEMYAGELSQALLSIANPP
jgi:hypothetical protein